MRVSLVAAEALIQSDQTHFYYWRKRSHLLVHRVTVSTKGGVSGLLGDSHLTKLCTILCGAEEFAFGRNCESDWVHREAKDSGGALLAPELPREAKDSGGALLAPELPRGQTPEHYTNVVVKLARDRSKGSELFGKSYLAKKGLRCNGVATELKEIQ
ncbi:hypothetical protein WH47_00946 [Habropoda laboriosa]|uniref:Uncharacterized protein n=1 Tax=Habropoda laboriosa TaxID=597456 RepID=A0A0L7R716_9HYME|nr:hypothetical protein WH47_00946 [Habropoda laboriosa]